MLFRYVNVSWDCLRFHGFEEGEFDFTPDILLWLNELGPVFTDSDSSPIESRFPVGAQKSLPQSISSHDVWRSPEIKAYAESPSESKLSNLRALLELRLMSAADGYDSKLWELSPDTFFCAFISRDDKTYGGASIISSSLSARKMRAKVKKAAEILYRNIGICEDNDYDGKTWLEVLRESADF